jgi:CheY-like chemotaxis protein
MQMKRDFMPYGRVLVVDDVETNLYVAKGLMAPYGLSIETVTSGFEAVDKIKSGNVYDIIFMDHMMPKMDGIEATRIIRDLGYDKPIVALTANAVSGQAEMFLENGFDEFVSKPVDIRKLDIVLNKLIRDKYPEEVVEEARRQKTDTDKKPPVDAHLMEIFTRDAGKAIAAIEAIMKNSRRRADDNNMFIINVHSMKSALANIGEAELSETAKKLEQAAREDNFSVIAGETPVFLENLRQVIDRIKPKDDNEEIVVTEEDTGFLRRKLSDIKTACVEYSKKPAKEALSELRARKWPRHIKDKIGNICEYLLHSDFEEAARAAEEMLSS